MGNDSADSERSKTRRRLLILSVLLLIGLIWWWMRRGGNEAVWRELEISIAWWDETANVEGSWFWFQKMMGEERDLALGPDLGDGGGPEPVSRRPQRLVLDLRHQYHAKMRRAFATEETEWSRLHGSVLMAKREAAREAGPTTDQGGAERMDEMIRDLSRLPDLLDKYCELARASKPPVLRRQEDPNSLILFEPMLRDSLANLAATVKATARRSSLPR